MSVALFAPWFALAALTLLGARFALRSRSGPSLGAALPRTLPSPRLPASPRPGLRFGAFVAEIPLAEGSQGVVFRGRHLVTGRQVAIKCLHADAAGTGALVDRFLREGAVLAAIRSPSVPAVLDQGWSDEGIAYLVVDFVQGEPLEQLLAKIETREHVPVGLTLRVMLAVAETVEAIAALGIVHRDINPRNVLIDARSRVFLVDFGIAKSPLGNHTALGAVLGSVGYMAPEQARGEAVDERADVWSTGALGYRMLTGQRPHEAANEALVLGRAMAYPVPPVEGLRDVPEAAARVIGAALAFDRAQRPTAADLRASIEAALEGGAGSDGSEHGHSG